MQERPKENKEKLKPIRISFGQVVTSKWEGQLSHHVILDVGRDNWFITAEIIGYGGSQEQIGIAGTAGRENIDEIVGKRSKKQILKAMENYFGSKPSEAIVKTVEKYSRRWGRFIS
jgi:hypothetical protein